MMGGLKLIRKQLFLFVLLFLLLPSVVMAWTKTSHWNSDSEDSWSCIDRSGGGPQGSHAIEFSSDTPDPSNVLKIVYPAGWVGGHEPVHCWNALPSETEELYVQYYFKYSNGYQFHNGDNKQMYFSVGGGGNYYIAVNNGNVHFITQTYATNRFFPNTGSNPKINTNQWYKLTAHFVMNNAGIANGTAQIWINDQLVINTNAVGYRSSSQSGRGITEMTLTPVFGGGSDNIKNSTDYQYFDYTILSTGPIGVGSPKVGEAKIPAPPFSLNIK